MNERINILIVDDEQMLLNSLKKSLEVRDFNVTTVTSGEEAIKSAWNNMFDIALVDLKMPGMDGEETLKILKENHKWLEVIILTGHGSVESAVECTQSGAYTYLQKPCSLDSLMAALKDAYRKKVMNEKNLKDQEMDALIKTAMGETPREILKKLHHFNTKS